jgi:RNA polymerase sigma factor (sigma-70 family)
MANPSNDIKTHFKDIIETNYKKFYKHACIQVGCRDTAKDIVQEAFITAYEKLHTFQQKSSLETWIFGILNNKILEHFRNTKKSPTRFDTEFESILFNKNGSWKKEWIANDLFPIDHKENEKEIKKIRQFLMDCLNALKEKHKQVVLLRYYLNKKTEEICEVCQMSTDNVWQILHRSKLQLKICLQSKQKSND